jgi:UDP-N-acetyl-D-glucosamine/UDP-N-acetyl-D-galactosamine dehydrogenase
LGYQPEVILAGRRINNNVGPFIAQQCVKLLAKNDAPLRKVKVGIMGLTFKENVPDLRNSKIPDIIAELRNYGVEPIIHDPLGDAHEAYEEYKIKLSSLDEFQQLDVMILAVSHQEYLTDKTLLSRIKDNGVLMDVKSALKPDVVTRGVHYWSL